MEEIQVLGMTILRGECDNRSAISLLLYNTIFVTLAS